MDDNLDKTLDYKKKQMFIYIINKTLLETLI